MASDRGQESEIDEQYETQQGPIDREFSEGEDGGEVGRDVAAGAGVGAGLIVAIGFVLFVVVLLGYIIANAL